MTIKSRKGAAMSGDLAVPKRKKAKAAPGGAVAAPTFAEFAFEVWSTSMARTDGVETGPNDTRVPVFQDAIDLSAIVAFLMRPDLHQEDVARVRLMIEDGFSTYRSGNFAEALLKVRAAYLNCRLWGMSIEVSPVVKANERHRKKQAENARQPRGRIGRNDETISEIVSRLARSGEHCELTAKELWEHFVSELDQLGLDPVRDELSPDPKKWSVKYSVKDGKRKQLGMSSFADHVSKARKNKSE